MILPGLLALKSLPAQPAAAAGVPGKPPVLSLPVKRPAVATSAPGADGTLSVPADWAQPLPARARRAAGDLPPTQRELTEQRSAATEVWANTDGTHTVRIHAEPVHYRRAGATGWDRVDNTLSADPARPGWVRNGANAWTVRFGPIGPGATGGVELVTDAGLVRFAPELDQGASAVAPTVDGDTVIYRQVWRGVDVRYTVSGGAVRQEIDIRGRGRAVFPFTVEGLGLVAGSGTVAVTGAQAGQMALTQPHVYPSAGVADSLAAATPTLTATGKPNGHQRLMVGVDGTWLADALPSDTRPGHLETAGTGFGGPVVLDTTVVIGNSIHQSFKSDGTVVSQDGIRVGNSQGGAGGGDSYWRSVAAFPYWDQINGRQLLSAGLQLGVAQGTTTGYPVTAWWACSADYNGAVCGGDTSRRFTTTEVTGAATLDVTDLVGLWQYFGTQNGAFGFSGANTAGVYTYKRFHPPTLVLNVNRKPAAPSLLGPTDQALAITSTTPTLRWNAVTDPDGDSVSYTAKIATGADGESGLVATSPAGAATSWQVPAGVLQDGVTYYWKVFASDGHAWTASTVRRITVDRRLGAGAVSPTDNFGGVITNLVTGNASVRLPEVRMPTVGGGIGVDFAYNSQQTSGGLAAEYRVDADRDTVIDATDPVVLARNDAQVSFNWSVPAEGSAGEESTSPSPGVPQDWYSVRWRGFVALPAGQWQFGARSDDGVRVTIDGITVLDKWMPRSLPAVPDFQTGSIASGVRRITVDYFEADGPAAIELWARNAADPAQAFVVPAGWFSAEPRILPAGWSLQATDGGSAYIRAEVSDGSVTLYAPDGATTSFAKTAFGLAYAPPPGVDDVVVVNADGTVTVHADDGRTYLFRPDGFLDRVTGALDDQRSAAANASYDTAGRLTALTDPVSGRAVQLTYAPNAACPERPPVLGGDTFGPTPTGMLCKVDYWDGSTTQLYYKNGLLGYVRNPGDAYWGLSYDAAGRLIGYHDPTTFDAAFAGRTDWDKLLVEISYDGAGRVAAVTQPPPNQGDQRPAQTYTYAPASDASGQLTSGTAGVTRAGITGTYRTVAYDARGRQTRDTNALGQNITMSWNADDLVTSVLDSAGLKSTTSYDALDQPTDEWGPAPASMFNPDGTGQAGVPRQVTRYDEGLDGLAVRWWANPDLTGAPALHAHDPGPLSSDWGSGSPGTGVPADNFSGRYTGTIIFPSAGTYTLRFVRDNKLAVYLNDVIHLLKWDNTTSPGDDVTVTVTAANVARRLRIDYADVTGPAKLQMLWKTPGSSSFVTVPGSALRTGYSLETSTVDASGRSTTFSYTDATTGIGAQHGIKVRSTTDPAGAGLAETAGFETVGTGYVRQVSRTLPAGGASTSTVTYYGTGDSRDNPCTTASDAVHQGGLARLETGADPDGTGPQTPLVREWVHDAAGRTVASRVGTEPWTCTAYDARGRVVTVAHPAFGGSAARTVTYAYTADPDGPGPRPASPLVTTVTDPAGTIMSEVDLLGRPVAHRDVFGNATTFGYDLAGRETTSSGPAGTIEKAYDAANRLISMKRNGQVLADGLTYDAGGRPTVVVYPSGTGNAGNGTAGAFAYDTLGRLRSVTWFGPAWSLITSDEVTRDPTGAVVGQVVDGVDHHAGDDYRYDSSGRLIEAWVPGARYTYEFFDNGYCTAPGSYRNGNRTTTSVTPTGGAQVSTAYCYDHADRMYLATDPAVGTVSYDAHGNMTAVFGETHTYDAADRHVATTKASSTVTYVRDALDRIVERRVNGAVVARYGYTGGSDAPAFAMDTANTVQETTFSLPGGALLTIRAAGNVWSYPNIHGDLVAIANSAGAKVGATTIYDPYGNQVAGNVPDNSAGNLDYGWLGQHQRPLEHEAGIQPVIEMGARQYSPLLGRFLEVDPEVDGSCNAYDYVCNDSVNSIDLDGHRRYHVYFRYGIVTGTWYLSRNLTRLAKVWMDNYGYKGATVATFLCAAISKSVWCGVIAAIAAVIGIWLTLAKNRNACATVKVNRSGFPPPSIPMWSNGKNCYTNGTQYLWRRAK
ncbi:hypothetical protein Rhe02_63630 [Rhizocola hellebori]|uniref:PA14 domain-containing protein n=1 Tax=Rhizocola hellebori TaxID=1392758 RepID=A0A8J3QCV6_9ACTN|nr:hypothetical protein Rhe02_63630 [Rhizocola hellebori]